MDRCARCAERGPAPHPRPRHRHDLDHRHPDRHRAGRSRRHRVAARASPRRIPAGPRRTRSSGGATSARSAASCWPSPASARTPSPAVGVTGMLPAVVLLDARRRPCSGRSIQQSDGRAGAEVEELRREVDEAAFLARTGNGVNQQLVAPKLRWLRRHEPDVFARIATVLGSLRLRQRPPDRRARRRAQLGARGRLLRPRDRRDRRRPRRARAASARGRCRRSAPRTR